MAHNKTHKPSWVTGRQGYRETVGAIHLPARAKIVSALPLKAPAGAVPPWACPKPAGIIAKGAHSGSRCIFLSTTSRHHHHRRPQGKPQPSPCHHIPAFSPLPASGHGRCHNPHDAKNRCNRQAVIARAIGVLMGVALSFPAEMQNQFLELPHFSYFKLSKSLTISNYQKMPLVPKILKYRPYLKTTTNSARSSPRHGVTLPSRQN